MQARHWLSIDTGGRERAQRLLAAALGLPQSGIVLEDRSLILACYDVESALAAVPDWNPAVRDRLRRAAEALADDAGTADLADRLQAQADRLAPDLRGLQDLALALFGGPSREPTSAYSMTVPSSRSKRWSPRVPSVRGTSTTCWRG